MRPGAGSRLLVYPTLPTLPTLATFAALAVVAASGCKRATPRPQAPPPKPALAAIALDNLALPPDKERLDGATIEAELRRMLGASGMFAAAAGDAGAAPTARARLAFTAECLEAGGKGEARARVRIRVDTRPSDAPGAVAFDLEGQGVEPYAVAPAPAKGRAPAAAEPSRKLPSVTALVMRITGDLIEGVAGRQRLQEGIAGGAARGADCGRGRAARGSDPDRRRAPAARRGADAAQAAERRR